MLPKKNRVDQKTLNSVFSGGKFINSTLFSFKFIAKKDALDSKISIAVPKTLYKSAVSRNRLKRMAYNVLREYKGSLPKGISGVFVFKHKTESLPDIKNEIEKILGKIN